MLVVKYARCIDDRTIPGVYITDMDGDTIDVNLRNFGILFTFIQDGDKPGSIKYLGTSDRYNYYEVSIDEQDWEKLQNHDFTW